MIRKGIIKDICLGCSIPVAHVGGGLAGQTPQDEQQQLVVVPLVRQVPADEVRKLSRIN